ncbi:MAG: TonB-dependent receptor, partial [Limnochordales bacterium]
MGLGLVPGILAAAAGMGLLGWLTERLALSGGLRYTDEKKSNTFAHYGQIVVPEPLVFGNSRTDSKISIDFSATDNVFLYAQAATGYRSEGANPRIFTIG